MSVYQPMCNLFIIVILKDCMSYSFPSPDCHNLLKKRGHAIFFLSAQRNRAKCSHQEGECGSFAAVVLCPISLLTVFPFSLLFH